MMVKDGMRTFFAICRSRLDAVRCLGCCRALYVKAVFLWRHSVCCMNRIVGFSNEDAKLNVQYRVKKYRLKGYLEAKIDLKNILK